MLCSRSVQNILLTREGHAKIADVGLAQVLEGGEYKMDGFMGTFAWAGEPRLQLRHTTWACVLVCPSRIVPCRVALNGSEEADRDMHSGLPGPRQLAWPACEAAMQRGGRTSLFMPRNLHARYCAPVLSPERPCRRCRSA